MKRLRAALLAALLALLTTAPPAGAQEVGDVYTSTATGIGVAIPAGWEMRSVAPQPAPVIDVLSAARPGGGRAASVVLTQLRGDASDLSLDDYADALDMAAEQRGEVLVFSEPTAMPGAGSASGEWLGVLQIATFQRDGVDYEHVRFGFLLRDVEFTISAIGEPGSAQFSAGVVGILVGSLTLS